MILYSSVDVNLNVTSRVLQGSGDHVDCPSLLVYL